MTKEFVRKSHEDTLRGYDNLIEKVEQQLKDLQEGRREYINRHNLNKDGTLKQETL